jgi:tRNA threonylcarbamoyladenosine biosynthesis protein TsaB
MINLGIETSAMLCGIAIYNDDKFLGEFSINSVNLHDQKLITLIDNLLSSLNISSVNLDCISISIGPGSFTGLRIGLSAAKGLCIAGNTKLVAVNTLDALAHNYYSHKSAKIDHPVCTLIDAKRDEYYHALYDSDPKEGIQRRSEYECEHITNIIKKFQFPVTFAGKEIKKIQNSINLNESDIYSFEDLEYNPRIICEIGNKKLNKGIIEELNNLQPFYLKDFIPINKLKEV